MEYMAFDKCMTFILGSGIAIASFISDRHTSIAKHMKEKLAHIKHYFDLWHIKKSKLFWYIQCFTAHHFDSYIFSSSEIHKVLLKISKESNCEGVVDWIKPFTNHFYWSVVTTITGSGKVIWVKFKSYLSHITNKHGKLDDPLFDKCAHSREIPERKWLQKGNI